MKYRTLEASSTMLETFFSSTLENTVTTEAIYRAWGRATEDEAKNKAWLSSTLTHLKHHDLVKPMYGRKNNRKSLLGLELTKKGKAILGRDTNGANEISISTKQSPAPVANQLLNYDHMLQLVAQFKKENPQYQVTFNISLKEE